MDIPIEFIDISVVLSEETIIYPGDPKPEYGLMFSLDTGGIANVGYLRTGIHHGTYVDVPYHFKNSGSSLNRFPWSIGLEKHW